MIAIFSDLAEALAFDAAVSAAMGWPSEAAKTERYAEPQKHLTQDLWAMPVEEYAATLVPQSAEVVGSLSEDWYPPRP